MPNIAEYEKRFVSRARKIIIARHKKKEDEAGKNEVFFYNKWVRKEDLDDLIARKTGEQRKLIFDLVLLHMTLGAGLLIFVRFGTRLLFRFILN